MVQVRLEKINNLSWLSFADKCIHLDLKWKMYSNLKNKVVFSLADLDTELLFNFR